ncbi:MAG: hypothetical protein Ct9H300mP1_14970 [Planctomycetaceae bacterium]|nr:MAG: hypothetical protein Ct9H300mP1_14970 [Planctomycetaceae bacterium]
MGGGDLVKTIGPTMIEVDARAHIDDLNERFGYGCPRTRTTNAGRIRDHSPGTDSCSGETWNGASGGSARIR